jgi:conjugative transposon TraM protein
MEQQSQKLLRRRRFLMVLPLLVFPFLTLAFWAMGGGKGFSNTTNAKQSGLNLELPNANLKNDAIDKLGFYEKATRDSLKLKEEMENDPYLKKNMDLEDTFSDHSMENILPSIPQNSTSDIDVNEEKVYNKLRQLNDVVNSKKNSQELNTSNYSTEKVNNDPVVNKKDVDRLGQMLDNMNQSSTEEDPEMKQMNGMLEKILEIQHPERVSEKIEENSIIHKRQVYPVITDVDQNNYLFSNGFTSKTNYDSNKLNNKSSNQFYSITSKNNESDLVQNSIQAVVHETQILVDGSTVKLRLMNDIFINGLFIPKDNFIYGKAALNGDRLMIIVKSILFQNNLLPVNLSVFDLDGLEGIYIPGSITNDVVKQTSNDALQNMSLDNLNSTISTQAISAGIEAGKNLLTRKAKLIKVTVKAGYHVLLQNNNDE